MKYTLRTTALACILMTHASIALAYGTPFSSNTLANSRNGAELEGLCSDTIATDHPETVDGVATVKCYLANGLCHKVTVLNTTTGEVLKKYC